MQSDFPAILVQDGTGRHKPLFHEFRPRDGLATHPALMLGRAQDEPGGRLFSSEYGAHERANREQPSSSGEDDGDAADGPALEARTTVTRRKLTAQQQAEISALMAKVQRRKGRAALVSFVNAAGGAGGSAAASAIDSDDLPLGRADPSPANPSRLRSTGEPAPLVSPPAALAPSAGWAAAAAIAAAAGPAPAQPDLEAQAAAATAAAAPAAEAAPAAAPKAKSPAPKVKSPAPKAKAPPPKPPHLSAALPPKPKSPAPKRKAPPPPEPKAAEPVAPPPPPPKPKSPAPKPKSPAPKPKRTLGSAPRAAGAEAAARRAAKAKAPKPPEPPWKTFEPAGDSRRERKEPDRLEGGRAPNPVELKRQFEEMREKGDTRPPSEAFKRQKA